MLAVQFGAGNIGRGFVGALLRQANYDVIFADVVDSLVDKIASENEYTIHITDVQSQDLLIEGVSAVDSKQNISSELLKADLITTAVGVGVLPKIAPTIAKGIIARKTSGVDNSLNIIACENAVLATDMLKNSVYEHLSEDDKDFADKYVGFANCSVDRIVPPVAESNTLDVCVENYYEWNVCEAELKAPLNIEGVNLVDDLEPYIERKLFTLNTGHAICAYLGFLKGKSTIEESINYKEIYEVVKASMQESGRGLCKKFDMDEIDHNKYIEKIIQRFKNPHLHDEVTRVGRDPLRKLSIDDRLVKPMLTAYEYEFPVDNLITGIAAALHFNNPEDEQSVEMQEKIAKFGLRDAVADITGLQEKSLLDRIEQEYYKYLEE